MPEPVFNPRREPRATVALAAHAMLPDGRFWVSPTADCGPGGCQLVAPVACTPGDRISLEVQGVAHPEPVRLSGRIAWAERGPSRRIGVEYDAKCRPAAAALFVRLASSAPALVVGARAPRSLAPEARVVPSPSTDPRTLRPLEAELLRAVGSGTSVSALRDALGVRWESFVNPLFALLDRRHLVVMADGGRA
jgi:hypothetical protein